MLVDRVMGLTNSQMSMPRYYRRMHSPVRIVSPDGAGVRTRHNLLLLETQIDKPTIIVMAAVCHDHVVPDGGRLRLRERIVVFDSEMVPNSLIYPP